MNIDSQERNDIYRALFDNIIKHMDIDEDCKVKKVKKLHLDYISSNSAIKDIYDMLFINLTGFGYNTLYNEAVDTIIDEDINDIERISENMKCECGGELKVIQEVCGSFIYNINDEGVIDWNDSEYYGDMNEFAECNKCEEITDIYDIMKK